MAVETAHAQRLCSLTVVMADRAGLSAVSYPHRDFNQEPYERADKRARR
jgi:hypothetical protein